MIDLTKITQIFEDLKSYQFTFFKTKIFQIGALGLCAIILTLFMLPLILNNAGLKFQIEQDVSKSLGANFTINSDLEVSFLPAISLSAKNILLQNYGKGEKVYNIYARSAQVDLSFFELLLGNVVSKKITFTKAILESYHAGKQTNHQNQFTDIRDKILKNYTMTKSGKSDEGLFSKLSLSNLDPSEIGKKNTVLFVIEESEAVLYDSSNNKKEIQNIFSDIKIANNKISANGEFFEEGLINHFNLFANVNSSWSSSVLEISSAIFNLKIKGDFSSEGKDSGILQSNFKGKIEAEILELNSFYNSYIGSNEAIYKKLKPGINPIKISGDIESVAGEGSIKNIIFNSILINGKGNIDFDLSLETPVIDISLDLDNLDLDNIWSSGRVDLSENVRDIDHLKKSNNATTDMFETLPQNSLQLPIKENDTLNLETKGATDITENTLQGTSDFLKNPTIKNIDLTSEIKIKTTQYLNGEIKDIDLYLISSKSGEVVLLPIIFNIPGNGTVRINGTLYQDNNLPRLVGKIDASGTNLKDVFSWFKIESQNLKYDNLKDYILYSDIFLTPNSISLDNLYLNLNNDQSEFLGEIKLDGRDKTMRIHNKFRISSFNIDDYFLISGQNAYLSPGSLLKKTLWLNDINSDNNLELMFDKLTYKGESFFNQSVKLLFGQGYFEISDLKLKSESTDLSAKLKIDISDNDPHFDLNIAANSFKYTSLQQEDTVDENSVNTTAADQFFALPSLEDFDGSISLKFDNLTFNNLEITNATLFGNLKKGTIEKIQSNCDIYEGKLDYKGLISLKYFKTISGILSFTDIQLGDFLSDLFDINNIEGIANISASLISSANSKEEFVKNISSSLKFNANAPIIHGYGLDDLVKKMFNPKVYYRDLQDLDAILSNPKSKTSLKEASGTLIINKDSDNQFKIDLSGTAINGIVSGKIDLSTHKAEALANVIFLTGDRRTQVPINIATSLQGTLGRMSYANNLNQAKQYLGISTPNPELNTQELQPIANQNINNRQDIDQRIKDAMENPDAYMQNQQLQSQQNQ